MSFFSLGLLIISIFFFIAGYVILKSRYKKVFLHTYDVKNHFPYELNFEMKFIENLYGNLFMVLSFVFIAAFYIVNSVGNFSGYRLIILFAGLLSFGLFFTISYTPLKTLRIHILFSSLLFIISLALTLSNGFLYLSSYKEESKIIYLIFVIISFLVSATLLVAILNPRLSLNIKIKHDVDALGNQITIRPKIIPFAFMEWLSLFVIYLVSIIYLIYIFII